MDVIYNCIKHKKEFSGDDFLAGDNIYMSIFPLNPSYSADDYVFSKSPEDELLKNDFLDHFSKSLNADLQKDLNQLSSSEINILGKLLEKNKRYIIFGPPGSGKSTTLRFLLKHFIEGPGRQHECRIQHCNKKRSCMLIDLKELDDIEFNDPKEARSYIINALSNKIESYLYKTNPSSKIGVIDLKTDLSQFWDWMMNETSETDVANMPALSKIKHYAIEDFASLVEIKTRKRIRNEFFSDPSDKLDYLLCLVHYINKCFYNESQVCFGLFFDNIDYADPLVQLELFKIIDNRISNYEMNMIMVMRTEKIFNSYSFTKLIAYLEHKGPSASSILKEKLNRFLNTYKTPEELVSTFGINNTQLALSTIRHIRRIIQSLEKSNDQSVFSQFMNTAMKRLLRSSIKASQYLIHNRIDFINSDITDHHLLRAFFRNSLDYYNEEENRSPVSNLFRCIYNGINNPLLKSRILSYIVNSPAIHHERSHDRPFLNQSVNYEALIKHLNASFHYERDSIFNATIQMIQPSHHLLFCQSGNYRSPISGDKIYITDTGLAYFEHVMSSLDYIQEMMLSCPCDKNQFIKINNIDFGIERLIAAIKFSEYLLRTEQEEYNLYLQKDFPKESYTNFYGTSPMFFNVLLAFYSQLRRIHFSLKDNSKFKDNFYRVLTEYDTALSHGKIIDDEFQSFFSNRMPYHNTSKYYFHIKSNLARFISEA